MFYEMAQFTKVIIYPILSKINNGPTPRYHLSNLKIMIVLYMVENDFIYAYLRKS